MSRWQSGVDEDPFDEEVEDAEEELEEGEWELDPNDPTHPDHDLSLAAGYADWEPASKPWLMRRGVVLALTVLVLLGLMIPLLNYLRP
jgi:hypothetical protein